MNFSTPVIITKPEQAYGYHTSFFFSGSCFAMAIEEKMRKSGFQVSSNPSGIVYNPISLFDSLTRVIEQKPYTLEELVFHNSLYHSMMHHGSMSGADANKMLEEINLSQYMAFQHLQKTNLLVLTLGTAYVFRYIPTNKIVVNCHKIPAANFLRYRLQIPEIILAWQSFNKALTIINPNIKILLTVSPVRHLKDGANGNQLSKSVLLLAVDEIISENPHTKYFPSYEIFMDELRDYRFYAPDMVHPSEQAVEYIWELFQNSHFDNESLAGIAEIGKINRLLAHRTLHPETDQNPEKYQNALKRLNELQRNYPTMQTQSIKAELSRRINQMQNDTN